MGASASCINAMILIEDQGLMSVHLGPKGGRLVRRHIHPVTALVVQAEEGLHLHISGRHECPGSFAQVNGFLSLIDMESQGWPGNLSKGNDPCLYLQGRLQLRGKFLAPLLRSAEDAQTGSRG